MIQCWAFVHDVDPSFNHHWVTISCLPGWHVRIQPVMPACMSKPDTRDVCCYWTSRQVPGGLELDTHHLATIALTWHGWISSRQESSWNGNLAELWVDVGLASLTLSLRLPRAQPEFYVSRYDVFTTCCKSTNSLSFTYYRLHSGSVWQISLAVWGAFDIVW